MPDPTPGPPDHDLRTVKVKVADLVSFPGNARRGDVDAIVESLTELGQFRPIVVNKGTHTGRPNEVLAGNHTLAAARRLKKTHIRATYVDVDEVIAKKIVLADNRTNDLATYDDSDLAALLHDLGRDDLAGTGYTDEDYDQLVDDLDLPGPMELPTEGSGEGSAALMDVVQWGFLQWRQTRVRISPDEVKAIDDLHQAYVENHSTDVGFGNHLARGLGLDD